MPEESKLEAVESAETLLEKYDGPQNDDKDAPEASSDQHTESTLHRALELVKPLHAEIRSTVCFRNPGNEKKLDEDTMDLYIRTSSLLENIYFRLGQELPCQEFTENQLEWRVCNALLSESFDEIRSIGNEMWSKNNDFRRAWAYYTVAICISGGNDTKSMCNRAVVASNNYLNRRRSVGNTVDDESIRALYDGWESARRAYHMDPEYIKANLYAAKCSASLGLSRDIPEWTKDAISTCLQRMGTVESATTVNKLDSDMKQIARLAQSTSTERSQNDLEWLESKMNNPKQLLDSCGEFPSKKELAELIGLTCQTVHHIVRTSCEMASHEMKIGRSAPDLPKWQAKAYARQFVDNTTPPPREETVPLHKRLEEINDKDNYFNGNPENLKTVGDMERGIRVLAQRDFALAEEIQIDEPYFAASVFTDRLCEFCLKPLSLSQSVRKCPGCDYSKYCCEKCQSDAWSMYHRVLCGRTEAYQKLLKKTYDEGVEPHSRMPLHALKLIGFIVQCHVKTLIRCDIRKFRENAVTARGLVEEVGCVNRDWLNYAPLLFAYPRSLFTGGGAYTTHQNSSCSKEMMDRFHLLQEALKGPITCKGNPPSSFARPLKRKQSEKLTNVLQSHPLFGYRVYVQLESLLIENLKTANVQMYVPDSTPAGCLANSHVLLRSTAFLKHSCCPNVGELPNLANPSSHTRYLTGKRIPKGTQLTVSYVPEELPRAERRQQLQVVYDFECTCPRCLAGN